MWKPITRAEFEHLLAEERLNLVNSALRALDRFAVPLSMAKIRRSELYGDEDVFVVAESPNGVIYFDDVEWGFEFSPLDIHGCIESRGASQMNLVDVVESWLVPQLS
ncbi:MAG TPA: hypothetical protein VFW23_03415 [Tepidisphaeraceae bacterium]|nr:hypothetical protein [Tepidisphaeraceae bacterium]